MLVGESKPYCSALLWVEKNKFDDKTAKAIDTEVKQMNNNLSNPEKVKKWAILVNTLSIEKGELTPNLKLKRNVVAQRFAMTMEALYGGERPKDEAIYGGSEKEG
jgi:long-chain acyl-CoA synthetase